MSGYLVDTCAISEFQKPSPDLGVVTWFARTALSTLYLSAITVGELRYGIALLRNRERRKLLEAWLTKELILEFEGRILSVDAETADRWGRLRAEASRAGKPIAVLDGLLAATALQHNLSIVTRNEHDFVGSGATVIDPWSDSAGNADT